ncbi:MAG: tripartite tricarboxylate transporter TctB family protein [Pseudomonadota bacterium]
MEKGKPDRTPELQDISTTDASAPAEGKVPSRSGIVGGLFLIGLSLIFIIGGFDLGLGIPTRLGTGAFPVITGLVVLTLSVFIFFDEIKGKGIAERPDWIGFVAILAAIGVFGLSAERFGLVPAAFLAVIIASLPDRSLPIIGKILLAIFVSAVSWLLFIELLNLPFKPVTVF